MYIDNPQLFSGSLSGSIILDQAFLEDNLIPNADGIVDLGSPSQRYRAIHVQSITSSIHTSSIDNFPTEVSRSAAAAGFGAGGGGGSYTLTNTDIAGLGVGIVSSSDQTVANLPDGTISSSAQISASAAASGFGSGGGGSYTLTNTDIQGLGVGIVSSSGDIVDLGAGIVSGSGYISSSISGQVITFNQSDGTTESVTVPSGGGGGADNVNYIFNPRQRYFVYEDGSDATLHVECYADMNTNVQWNRNGADIGITSSVHHHLTASNEFVWVRNMGDTDGSRLNVKSVEDDTHFTVTSASNSGAVSGTHGAWSPALSGDVTHTSGDVSNARIDTPFYHGHSIVLHSYTIYGVNGETAPIPVLVPTGSLGPGSAGTGNNLSGMHLPTFRATNWGGTGTQGALSGAAVNVRRGAVTDTPGSTNNYAAYTLNGTDPFGPFMFTVYF